MPIASALRSVLRWFGIASIILAAPLMRAQTTGQAADGFDPNVNGNVYALVVQADGNVLIGGQFTTFRPNGATQAIGRNNLARVLPSGLVDESYSVNVNGQVSAMVMQADGKIVIGGKFTSVNNVTRNRVARLNPDGSLDTTFDPNVGGGVTPEVTALALQADQKLLVGGGFTTVQPNGAATATTRNRIARFNTDGSLDATLDVGANNMVLSLAVQSDGKILIGGGFTSLQPAGSAAPVARNRIARLDTDGSIESGFNPDVNNAVSAIALLPDGDILIGGSFTTLGSENVNRLVRLNPNGSRDTAFVGSTDGQVYVLKVAPDGRIFVGGSFSTAGGGSRSYVARLLPTGALDTTFVAGPNFNVYAVAPQADGSAILGGGFTTIRGSGVTPVVRNHVARVSSTGVVDADFRPDANGRLRAVAIQTDGNILVGGSFTSVGGVTHSGIVRLKTDGSVDPSFNASVTGTVLTIVQEAGGKIIIGGTFQRVNGAARFNLARLLADGTLDQTFETSVNNTVNALAVLPDGKILAGGTFTVLRANTGADSVTREYIARINANGSLDDTFKLRTNGAIQAIVIQSDGKVLMGGAFSGASGDGASSVERSGLLRLNTDGSVDSGFASR
ncbi:MAG TPA: delta-60 repeat domain-containing protein, partial [Opitutus sp.]|nr:delta-60 repeat domain-containing protein [Opitutus sp.]